ncbi:MAG: YhcB family protein [bacterium]
MSTTSILIALGCLAAGLVIGFFLNKATSADEKQKKDLEDQLQKARDELTDYQQQVTAHFLETANHVNELTDKYRDLHEHLSTGAIQLASPEISRRMLNAGDGQFGSDQNILNNLSEMPQPPKDYAPKVPGGVLSETYGLEEETPAQPAQEEGSDEVSDDDDPTLKVG